VGDLELEQRLAVDLERRDELQGQVDARRAADRARLAALQAEVAECETKALEAIAATKKDELALVKKREGEQRYSTSLDQTRRLIAQLVTPTLAGGAIFGVAIIYALPSKTMAVGYTAVALGFALGLGVSWFRRRAR
jgi:hypothetical protein